MSASQLFHGSADVGPAFDTTKMPQLVKPLRDVKRFADGIANKRVVAQADFLLQCIHATMGIGKYFLQWEAAELKDRHMADEQVKLFKKFLLVTDWHCQHLKIKKQELLGPRYLRMMTQYRFICLSLMAFARQTSSAQHWLLSTIIAASRCWMNGMTLQQGPQMSFWLALLTLTQSRS